MCFAAQAPDVSEVPKSPALSLAARPKDFASPLPSRQAPIIAPVKEVQLEMQRRNLLDKKCESSPNLLRKKEAISQVFSFYQLLLNEFTERFDFSRKGKPSAIWCETLFSVGFQEQVRKSCASAGARTDP